MCMIKNNINNKKSFSFLHDFDPSNVIKGMLGNVKIIHKIIKFKPQRK